MQTQGVSFRPAIIQLFKKDGVGGWFRVSVFLFLVFRLVLKVSKSIGV